MWQKLKRNKAQSPSASPPETLSFDHEDAPPGSSVVSSHSSTMISNSGGLFSTPPSNEDSGNCSPLSISPNTPKKDWELSYKNYLSDLGDNKSGDEDPSSDGSHNFKEPDLRHGVASQKDLTKSLPYNYLHPSRHRSDQGILYGKNKLPLKKDDIDGSGGYRKKRNTSPPRFIQSDEPIHGGKFFSGVFSRRKDKAIRAKISENDLDTTNSRIKARTQSFGSLDTVLKNGSARIERGGESTAAMASKNIAVYHPTGTKLIRPKAYRDNGKKKDKQRQKKLAFTEHHNSHKYGSDTTAAYLGEEKSIQRGTNFAMIKEMEKKREEASKRRTEDLRDLLASQSTDTHKSRINLTPIEGTDEWVEGRRYLMTPAIIAACPKGIFSLFEKGNDDQNGNQMFSEVDMGVAGVAQIVSKGLLQEDCEWSSGEFVLRQNYLLEYEKGKKSNCRPRGFAFLQNASIRRHDSFDNTIRVDYFQNYPESSTRKSILFQLDSEKDRDRWYSSLVEAARLKLEDLYEYDASASGTVLGEGRFSTVYPGRRRRGKRSSSLNLGDLENKANGLGILKKKPSFTSFQNLTLPLAEDDYECALKIIDKDTFWKRVRKDKERADSIVRETSVQASLLATSDIFPGFLRVKSFFETLDKVVLEMELLDGIDLFRYISKKESLSEVEAAQIMYDIISCVKAMNNGGIAHRDIKPANILMADKKKSSGVCVKLGDFGMATFVGKDNLVRGRCGTPGYVAPEIMSAKKNGGYENKVDMFSAGVLMYILLCGYEPFYGECEKELIAENSEAKVDYPRVDWESVSLEGRDLVERMLERDPSKRIVASKALEHPWITRRASGKNQQQ